VVFELDLFSSPVKLRQREVQFRGARLNCVAQVLLPEFFMLRGQTIRTVQVSRWRPHWFVRIDPSIVWTFNAGNSYFENFMRVFLKWLVVLGLSALGLLFLLQGIGVNVSAIKYKHVETRGVPFGLVVIALAALLGICWRVRSKTEYERVTVTENQDGSRTRTSESGTIAQQFRLLFKSRES
jgi:hypothetical protein